MHGIPPFMGFPGGSVVKNLPGNAGDTRDVGSVYPLEYSCLENSMDRGAWRAIVHGATKSWTHLSAHTHTTIHPSLHYIFPTWGAFCPWNHIIPSNSTIRNVTDFKVQIISFFTSEVSPNNPGWSSSVPLTAVSSLTYSGLCTYLATQMIFPSNPEAGWRQGLVQSG